MEAALAAIHGALDEMHAQRADESAALAAPAYFTNAVLRTGQVDILELIRDADQLEASLFSYPPAADGAERGEPVASAPALRPVRIPTPVRRSVHDAPGEHTTAFYLASADQLVQN